MKTNISTKSFSIIVPAFNEFYNLKKLYEEIINSLRGYNFEIIFIDDCSTDDSLFLLKTLSKNDKKIKILSNKSNSGQSYSIFKGAKNSSHNTIVTIDADLQNDPKDIIKLLNIYFNSKYELIGGIRIKRNDSVVKILSSKIANYVRSSILKDKCSDTGCSLKVFNKRIFTNLPYFDGIHRFLPALFSGFGYATYFVEVNHRKRIAGESKYGVSNRLFRGIKDMLYVKKIIKQNKLYK